MENSQTPDPQIEINGIMMTRRVWQHYMHDCPHEHWTHAAVKLMDGSEMSICDRCKRIELTVIAKTKEGEEFVD